MAGFPRQDHLHANTAWIRREAFYYLQIPFYAAKHCPDDAKWTSENDTRITRVGHILRLTHLDELPQLLNIFMGEMSFVGPRPERPTVYDDLDGKVENFRSRMQVMPGLTGYAQVNGGYDLNPAEKLKYDLIYINHCSVLFDLWCLLKTIPVVFTMKGAR